MKKEPTLQTYIDLKELLASHIGNREENRSFALNHQNLIKAPIALLAEWTEAHRHRLSLPLISQRVDRLYFGATLILLITAFLLGLLMGAGVLGYSGSKPVNILYFLAAALFIPLTTMFFTILALVQSNNAKNMLVHLSPAYWFENILLFLPKKNREILEKISLHPTLVNWSAVHRAQEFGLVFSIGLLFSLVWIISSRDIAFGWSTTLQIAPAQFHSFVSMVAFPWREFFTDVVPSLELIEKSRFFRLGGDIGAEMKGNAGLLGEWWKFLAMTTLFYAIVLRFIFFVFTYFGLKRALARSLLLIDGAKELLRQMQEPLIETSSTTAEEPFEAAKNMKYNSVSQAQKEYASTIGWALELQDIDAQNERLGIRSALLHEAGGVHSIAEDEAVAKSLSGKILLYVKAWEPPTGDFVDFLEALNESKVGSIEIYPLGEPTRNYQALPQNSDVWRRTIGTLESMKIRMLT